MPDQKDKYIKELEETISKFMAPLKSIPFPVAIKAISGFEVIHFKTDDKKDQKLLKKLVRAAQIAGEGAFKKGIFSRRVNEVGNKIEPFVKEALKKVGLEADIPVAKNGKKMAVGYPDLELTDDFNRTTYLECKTYNLRNIDTTQRAFYFSPSKNPKITKDARHIILSFQIETGKRDGRRAFLPVHWRLYDTTDLLVDVKHEFQSDNRRMYGRKNSLLAEGSIKKSITS